MIILPQMYLFKLPFENAIDSSGYFIDKLIRILCR